MSLDKFAFQQKTNGSIVIYNAGKSFTIPTTAVNHPVVLDALKAGDYEKAVRVASVADAVADLSDGRVKIFGNEIYLDGSPVHNALTSRIVAMFRDGFTINPLIRFLENVMGNPSEVSRTELYLFLEHNDLPITPDGCFLAYKVVNHRHYDCHSNTVDNSVGQTPRIERDEVDADRERTCSYGLHFCSFSYVQHFRGAHLMVVKINPADVVSIPSDYNNAKGRCCGYEVVDEVDGFRAGIKDGFTRQYTETDDEAEDVVDDEDVIEQDADIADTAFIADDGRDQAAPDYTGKLDAGQVREIRRLLEDDSWTLVGIAKLYGVSARQVARIRDGEAWADLV